METEAFLPRGRASSLPECEFTKEASRSMIKGLFLLAPCRGEFSPACSQTWALAAARALLIATNTFAGCTVTRTLNRRLIVGFEAISPCTSGWLRSRSMSQDEVSARCQRQCQIGEDLAWIVFGK